MKFVAICAALVSLPLGLAQTTGYPTCGGGRGENIPCEDGYHCVRDPTMPGTCGPSCDDYGVCILIARENACGIWEGFEEPLYCPEGKGCQSVGYGDPPCDPDSRKCGGFCV